VPFGFVGAAVDFPAIESDIDVAAAALDLGIVARFPVLDRATVLGYKMHQGLLDRRMGRRDVGGVAPGAA
jgi:hypothetical protein